MNTSQTLEALLAESDSSSDSDDPSSIISQPISSVDDSGVEINSKCVDCEFVSCSMG